MPDKSAARKTRELPFQNLEEIPSCTCESRAGYDSIYFTQNYLVNQTKQSP